MPLRFYSGNLVSFKWFVSFTKILLSTREVELKYFFTIICFTFKTLNVLLEYIIKWFYLLWEHTCSWRYVPTLLIGIYRYMCKHLTLLNTILYLEFQLNFHVMSATVFKLRIYKLNLQYLEKYKFTYNFTVKLWVYLNTLYKQQNMKL